MLFDGYAFDLDGTVYVGDAPLPGAVETIGRIRQAGRPVLFVTNNPLHSAEDYAGKLRSLGVDATTVDVVTATHALVSYLTSACPQARLLVLGATLLVDTLSVAGFALTAKPAAADMVVVSFDRTFDYAKLLAAYQAVRLHDAMLTGATSLSDLAAAEAAALPDYVIQTLPQLLLGVPMRHGAATSLDRRNLERA